MTTTRFDQANMKALHREIYDAIQEIATRRGIQLTVGRSTYTPENATIKIEAAVKSGDGMAITREATAFMELAGLYGLQPTDLGRSFSLRGTDGSYKIVGAKSSATKTPIVVERGDGRLYKLAAEVVVRALAEQDKAATR